MLLSQPGYQSRAADAAAPTAILGLRRCTARAARRTPNTTFGASAAIASTVSRPRVAQAPRHADDHPRYRGNKVKS